MAEPAELPGSGAKDLLNPHDSTRTKPFSNGSVPRADGGWVSNSKPRAIHSDKAWACPDFSGLNEGRSKRSGRIVAVHSGGLTAVEASNTPTVGRTHDCHRR